MAYTPVIVAVDPAQITQEKIDALQAAIPGLVIQQSHPLYHLLNATSDRDAENVQLLVADFDAFATTFGKTILRVPTLDAVQATGLSTWTRVGTTGDQLIPAGTPLTLAGVDGGRVEFTTRTDVTIPAGSSATGTGEVEIIASIAGTGGNDLQTDPQPDQTYAWLDHITVVAPTAGGLDAEDEDTYRGRVADEASLATKTLVQADNFAIAARDVIGVDRALAIDTYNPGPPANPAAPGHVTVAVIDATGADPGATIRGNVLAELQSRAISQLTPHVIAPTYTTITVVFAAKSQPGYDPTDVKNRAQQAVLDFLDPATWGLPALGDQRLWIDSPVVYFQDVVTVLNNVEGLDRIDPFTSLTINGGTSDVTMTGPAALPGPASSATGTVTAP